MSAVYFCTNRTPDINAPGGFGIVPASTNFYGTVYAAAAGSVSGTIKTGQTTGGCWPKYTIAQIASANLPVVVFFHGLGYRFPDVISECATMKALYAKAGSDATYLCYDWCESGQEVGDLCTLEQPYFDSQAEARRTAPLIAQFLTQIATLRTMLPASCPITILAHSMGNYALAGALDILPKGVGIIADRVVLAAADERWDSFTLHDGARLGHLPALTAGSISIYFGRGDEALDISESIVVNDVQRLGWNGPKDRQNATLFPASRFRLIDYTADEQGGILNPGETHDCYLLDPATINDIAMAILGTAGPVGTLALHETTQAA